jgi:predicted DNA-binding transcriptional regulator YafY
MPRNQEVIRQWHVLRAVAASRLGLTIDALAREHRVTTRTIRRDVTALEEAGFPLYQEKGDGPPRWKIEPHALRGLDTTFTLVELCALYFSRVTLEFLAGAPFHDDLQRAFSRFEQALTPNMRKFLDRLPGVIAAKRLPGGKRHDVRHRDRVAQLLDASLHRRKVRMRYYSLASRRAKDYDADPHRVVYAEGGLYLVAYVPEYREVRTFAVERIQQLSLRHEHFAEPPHPGADVFPHSLGVHSGSPERVEVEFSARVATYVAERNWHPSQKVQPHPDGSVRIELHVCNDWALRRWILGFGSNARVLAPSSLADDILDELEAAQEQYTPPLDLEIVPRVSYDLTTQRVLPFAELHHLS